MNNSDFDFDVAISFLSEDAAFAAELRERLGDALQVFIYTKQQEELAGTDGLQSLREIFRSRARLVVILHRERWGTTDWTRVEMEAITDRFLKEGPVFLFVIMMDKSAPPPWLPDKLLRFSREDFDIREAVGAIKARALERGSQIVRPSPAFLAQRAHERAEFGKRREMLLRSEAGAKQAQAEAERLIGLVEAKVNDAMSAAPEMGIEYSRTSDACGMRTPGVGVVMGYHNRIINVLDEARLVIRELRGAVLLPGQQGRYWNEPKELGKSVLTPDIARESGWCWKDQFGELHSSEQIATQFIERFFDLLDRQSAGKLPDIEW